MKEQKHTFILHELADLVDLPIRTVRYYIQIGLVDRPEGGGRGAHYTRRHLEQLIEIRKWQQAGLSLKRIRELLKVNETKTLLPPPMPREKGSIEIRSHVMIDEGIELTINPARSNLTPKKVRQLVDSIMEAYENIQTSQEQKPS
jgi:DNA-binding transcriptional MerR regulator